VIDRYRLTKIGKWTARMALVAVMAVSACLQINGEDEAVRLLDRALAEIGKQHDLPFSGTTKLESSALPLQRSFSFEGYIVNGEQLYIRSSSFSGAGNLNTSSAGENGVVYKKSDGERWIPQDAVPAGQAEWFHTWNPMRRFEQLKTLKKTVSVISSRTRGEKQLRIQLDPEDLKRWLADELVNQLPYPSAEELARFQKEHRLSDAEVAHLRQEMEASYENLKKELTDTVAHMTAEGSYDLTIDGHTLLPKRMSVEILVEYVAGGRTVTEKKSAAYRFGI